jgi:GNAT superfamily N-acetyltransferase
LFNYLRRSADAPLRCSMNWLIRTASREDVPALEKLIPLSVRALQAPFYSAAQIEAALGPIFGVDHQLIADETYFVAAQNGQLIGGGGWSRRQTICGSRPPDAPLEPPLDPARDAARIRAFFVHPDWARRGVGRAILKACEKSAATADFRRAELLATLAGEPLYAACGYHVLERSELEMAGGLKLPVVRMGRELRS